VRTYLSPIILPTNECCDGTAFWGTTEVLLGAGAVGAVFVGPVVRALFTVSCTVATVDASDMDFGRKGELIGKRVSLFRPCLSSATTTNRPVSHPLTRLQPRRSCSYFSVRGF